MNRRKFVKSTCSLATGISLLHIPELFSAPQVVPLSLSSKLRLQKIDTIPRLFCIAYISPDTPGQENQEHLAAKYPLIIVPQDTRNSFVKWRNRVRELNPDIIMLAYQMVIEETTSPGPGHDKVREALNPWCMYDNCDIPVIGKENKRRRLIDPRVTEWQDKFLDACNITLSSYDYDGLFLDQCDIFNIANPRNDVKNEMRAALQSTLLKLRSRIQNHIIIGNTRRSWAGLNGELNEANANTIEKELMPFPHHNKPVIELVQTLSRNLDKNLILSEMSTAHRYGAFYGAATDYQHILWLDEFEEIVNNTHRVT